MFEWFGDLFGNKATQAEAVLPPVYPMQVQPVTALVATSDNHDDFSLVEATNQTLGAALSRATVQRVGLNDMRPLPVSGVKLLSNANGPHFLREDAGETESVRLLVELNRPAGDYTKASLNAAVQQMLTAIPSLRGHLKPAEHKDEKREAPTAVWKELQPHLAGKFSVAEQTMLQHFFEPVNDDMICIVDDDHTRVQVNEGKVEVHFSMEKAEKGKETTVSGDQQMVDFVAQHKAAILTGFKKKLATIKDSPLSAQELETLDLTTEVKSNGYRDAAVVTFGAPGADGKLGETALSKVDGKILDTLFTEALVESTQELPPIFTRIADAALVKVILEKRCGEQPELKTIFEHDMFKSWDEKRAERRKASSPEHPVLPEITINEACGTERMKDTLEVNFALPKGVKDIETLRTDIVQNRATFLQGLSQGRAVAA